jgi:chemotaxis protein methyltransferase CheR
MKDDECVGFLQWALPVLNMRWSGFRKVRGQVCKRLQRRINALGLSGIAAYRYYLAASDDEWRMLDTLCRVSISRFYRDKQVFALLEHEVMPALARLAQARGDKALKVWSAGCASGEEPYSIALLWQLQLQQRFPGLELQVLASDADPQLIRRAKTATYCDATVKNLPPEWRDAGFSRDGEKYTLKPEFRQGITFRVEDIRQQIPAGRFHLVLCRNLVFTYYQETLQCQLLSFIKNAMVDSGVLVLGVHEQLPTESSGFSPLSPRLPVYRKTEKD